MAEIRVVINNYGKFCSSCHLVELGVEGWYCLCYRKYLERDPDGSFLRLTECIAAEGDLAALREAEKENKQWNEGTDCNTCPIAAWEECDEVCKSRALLISKIAELLTEIERGTNTSSLKWDRNYEEKELKAVINHLIAVLEDGWDQRAIKEGEQPDSEFAGIYCQACTITGRERKYFTQDYPITKTEKKGNVELSRCECGHEARLLYDRDLKSYFVKCTKCGASIAYRGSDAEAKTAWNNRMSKEKNNG